MSTAGNRTNVYATSHMGVGRARHCGRLLMSAVMLVAAGGLIASTGSGPTAFARHAPPSTSAPNFGPNVIIFNPDMSQSDIQMQVNAIANQQISNQFGTQRYALLFMPGTYGSASDPLTFQVGYYTEVAGLGASPSDVVINGTVDVYNQCFGPNNCIALDNFWRSLSNLTIKIAGQTGCETGTDFWAVSQAAPMRRVNITGGNLSLMDYCNGSPDYASGGFIADSTFSGGTVINGSQQQFFVRNSSLDGWSNGVWSQVFSGVTGAPPQSFSSTSGLSGGTPPYTTLPTSPVTREEPYLYVDSSGHYNVWVPAVQHQSVGTTWSSGQTPGRSLPIHSFYIAQPGDSVHAINAELARGKNLILAPGVYNLVQSIRVTRPDTIVLGLGFPTLIPQNGKVAMAVGNVKGAALSGMIIDAGPVTSPVLLQFGSGSERRGHGGHGRVRPAGSDRDSHDPATIQDVFFRIGGAEAGSARVSLEVNNSNVIIDDVWAWRADHGAEVGWNSNKADTGLIVNGDNVTAYGLFVEHFQKTEVIWNGQNGTDIFFQNEMPYDPPSQSAWMATKSFLGYPALLVTTRAKAFQGYGMGSYCYFNQGIDMHATTAFVVPSNGSAQMHDVLTRFLNGSGGIDHVVNDTGAAVTSSQPGPSDIVSYP